MEAWSGVGLLEQKEEDLLNLEKEKGMLLVWECSGMETSLRDAKVALKTPSLAALSSGNWRRQRRREEGCFRWKR